MTSIAKLPVRKPPTLTDTMRAATQAELDAEVRSLRQSESDWRNSDPRTRPENHLPVYLNELQQAIAPIFEPTGTKVAAVLLDKLFGVLPLPNEDGLATWLEFIECYPPDELRRGIDHVIRSHRWSTPPLIGELVEAIEQDPIRRSRMELRLLVDRLIQSTTRDLANDARYEEEVAERRKKLDARKTEQHTTDRDEIPFE
jgi:hypothetical protein